MDSQYLMTLIFIINGFLLFGLVMGILWWQSRHGRLKATPFAAILTGYFSFAAITTLAPDLWFNARATLIVDIVLLLLFWSLVFPWTRWIYGQLAASR